MIRASFFLLFYFTVCIAAAQNNTIKYKESREDMVNPKEVSIFLQEQGQVILFCWM